MTPSRLHRTTPSPPLRKLPPPRPLRPGPQAHRPSGDFSEPPSAQAALRPQRGATAAPRRMPPRQPAPGQPHRLCKGVPYGFRLRGLRYGNRGCSVFRHRCDNSPIIFQRLVRPEQKFTRNSQDQHGSGCGGNPRPVDPPYGPAGFCPGNLRPRSRTAQLALQTLPSPAGGGSSASRSAFRMALIQSLSCFIVLCESGSAG